MNKLNLLFKYTFTTRIHDIDAAGVMFFARFFYHIHDAYESFLHHHQFGIEQILKTDFVLPISHTEADFKAPVFLNESLNIEVFLQQIEEGEFTLYYHLTDSDKKIRATALTHHVCLNKNNKTRSHLPKTIINLLTK